MPSTGASYAVTGEVGGEAVGGQEQLHAQPLAAPVRLQDHRLIREVAPSRGGDAVAPGHQDGARRGDAVALQGGVLAHLADLQVQRARPVDHAPAPSHEPGQHRGGELRREAVVARMRRGAHTVVEHAFGRRRARSKVPASRNHSVQGSRRWSNACGQRRQPGRILVQNMDAAHGGPRGKLCHGDGFLPGTQEAPGRGKILIVQAGSGMTDLRQWPSEGVLLASARRFADPFAARAEDFAPPRACNQQTRPAVRP